MPPVLEPLATLSLLLLLAIALLLFAPLLGLAVPVWVLAALLALRLVVQVLRARRDVRLCRPASWLLDAALIVLLLLTLRQGSAP
ncbi:hypothetical protein [Deinococcus alpinitundrae]|uniref:hypothetical protein n=1 Tax=Deinococcus alpinitundrae TaxID=468913 RepID=UPI00137990CB|nr:hypothetical protein [Deinococcus alpinitundrae]